MGLAGWGRARRTLVLAALLDAGGLIGLFLLLARERNAINALPNQWPLMGSLVLIYWTLGWLFGSYTLLKLRRPTKAQTLARLAATGIGSIVVAGILEWIGKASPTLTLLHRGNVIPAFLLITLWSGLWRWALRRMTPQASTSRWLVLVKDGEEAQITKEWAGEEHAGGVPEVSTLRALEPGRPEHVRLTRGRYEAIGQRLRNATGLAVTSRVAEDEELQQLLEEAVRSGIAVTTVVELAEQELQRIPPSWIGTQWLLFSRHIDGSHYSTSQQLKRYADVLTSALLLLLSAPLWIVSAALVKLQDGGPVFYCQTRSGLYGQPFLVVKFRTMVREAELNGAQWAQENDHRITNVGRWLRRTRIDELPQLLNVLRGEMSLIGPRPERPELEQALEREIPNYRLRHWIRPGLSGWAQVNMPYSGTLEDAERKVGYDLFYLRNAGPALDLLITLKTIKTVLKAAGR